MGVFPSRPRLGKLHVSEFIVIDGFVHHAVLDPGVKEFHITERLCKLRSEFSSGLVVR